MLHLEHHREDGDMMTREEIQTAKQSMEQYVLFMQAPGQTKQLKEFYQGAASAINDLLCRLGHGDEVCELAECIQKDEG